MDRDYAISIILIYIFGIIALLVILKSLKKIFVKLRHKRINDSTTLIPQYSPPENLSPLEIAYLYDQSINSNEFLVVLMDLERRNYVNLTPIPATSANFVIKVIKDELSELRPYEVELMEIAKTQKLTWYSLVEAVDIKKIPSSLEAELFNQLYSKELMRFPTAIRHYRAFMIVVSLIISLPILYLLFSSTENQGGGYALNPNNIEAIFERISGNIMVIILPFIIFLTCLVRITPFIYDTVKGLILAWPTKRINQIWPKIAGFKEFVKLVELDQIQFENQEKRASTRNSVLPYAIALNLSTRWQDRFNVKQDFFGKPLEPTDTYQG